jgi:MFS family permease
MTGPLPPTVRHNTSVELVTGLAYGAFYAAVLAFMPVVLRRSGASAEMLAVYTSQQFVGFVAAAFSIVLMRRRRTMSVIVACWLVGRAVFLLFAFIVQPVWMIALSGIFWLLEAFPSPGYTRIQQKIYPDALRGKLMAYVRAGRVAAILVVTPLAGWALDHLGYPVLFPLGAVVGIAAALIFTRIRLDEGPLPPRETKALTDLWGILRADRRFSYYLLSFVFYGAGTLMAWTLYPLVQVDRLGLTYSQLGLLGLIQSIFWLAGYLFWGRLVDRRGGLFVLRATCGVAIFTPLIYVFATEAWMLAPAFAVMGIISAGWDMGLINSAIQLADPERVTEYAAIQTSVVGIRGIVAPLIGVWLLRLGMVDNGVFLLSAGLMVIAWFMLGRIHAPTPAQPEFAARQALRYRWPIRTRTPRM